MSSEKQHLTTNRWLAAAVIFLAVVVLVLLGMVFNLSNKKAVKSQSKISLTARPSFHHQRVRQQPAALQKVQQHHLSNNGMPQANEQFIHFQREMDKQMAAMEKRMHHLWQHKNSKQSSVNIQQSGLRLLDEPDNYIVQLHMQGINKNNVKVNLKQQLLTVSANISQKHTIDNKQQQGYQQLQSQMSQSVYLPMRVNAEKIKTKFKKDKLIITIPKQK